MCRWENFDFKLSNIIHSINENKSVIVPFPLLALTDDPQLHKTAAQNYATSKPYQKGDLSNLKPIEEKTEKIRIGYYSADFHNHATAYLIAEMIEQHDRDRFEIYGFSYGPISSDEMRTRLYHAFDEYIDVSQYGDRQIASLSRVLGIDIAVDLKGYTEGSRMGIFIDRCAPIQVSYLGFPGTTMLPEIDYIVCDEIVAPKGSEFDYSEKIIRLPHCYQANDSKRKISDREFTRKELNLPDQATVFCCFNNNYKILPDTFNSWMHILESVPNSVLWLLSDNIWAETNLQKEATTRGINPSRLIFAKRMPLADHLARFKQADLFLDTFPYNAHTTASDALWAGVPVLTKSGRSFASRVAASLLTNIGLPELITTSKHDFEKKAIELAKNPDQLEKLRAKIGACRTTSPLFNTTKFIKDFEEKMIQIYADRAIR
jgi:predicted O-linked N-acetylglucosamine transferase (SPINDLY family)